MSLLYFVGIFIGVLVTLIYKNTIFKGEAVPFIMELPSYRMPSIKNVSQLLWEKAKDFLQRAFTVIFLASIIVWLLQNFSFNLHMVKAEESILAEISNMIAPIFKPCGFGDWRITTSLFTGFIAKETVVSSLQVLFAGRSLYEVLSLRAVCSLLIYCLLYTPCIATINAIKQELGTAWALYVLAFQCILAWLLSFITYTLLGLFL